LIAKIENKIYAVQSSCSGERKFPAPLPDTKACNDDTEVTIYRCHPWPVSQALCSSVTTDYSTGALVQTKVAVVSGCRSSQTQVCAKYVCQELRGCLIRSEV